MLLTSPKSRWHTCFDISQMSQTFAASLWVCEVLPGWHSEWREQQPLQLGHGSGVKEMLSSPQPWNATNYSKQAWCSGSERAFGALWESSLWTLKLTPHWSFKHVATLERIQHQNLLYGAKSFSTGAPVESWFCGCSLQDGGTKT